MKKIILALLLTALMIAGCSGSLSNEELQKKIIDANSKITSYGMEMKMTGNMEITTAEGTQKINTNSVLNGNVDINAKKMKLTGNIDTDVAGQKQSQEMDMYMIDNMVYTKTYGQWVKQEQTMPWDQQDNMKQTVDLIQTGKIESQQDQTLNGKKYIVVKVTPDLKKMMEMAMPSQDIQLPSNLADLVKKYSVIVYINKESYVIEKYDIDMSMEMTAKDLGIETGTDGSMKMDIKTEVTLTNVNAPQTIELPSEALSAMSADELMQQYITESANLTDSELIDNTEVVDSGLATE